jgi:hypothetical protein
VLRNARTSFRCDDVTSSSENCKADGFYADPQH